MSWPIVSNTISRFRRNQNSSQGNDAPAFSADLASNSDISQAETSSQVYTNKFLFKFFIS